MFEILVFVKPITVCIRKYVEMIILSLFNMWSLSKTKKLHWFACHVKLLSQKYNWLSLWILVYVFEIVLIDESIHVLRLIHLLLLNQPLFIPMSWQTNYLVIMNVLSLLFQRMGMEREKQFFAKIHNCVGHGDAWMQYVRNYK